MEKTGFVNNWQRQFYVTDHIKHKNGFTLYKIISVVFPKKNPEAGTKIVVWKRYSDFKKLYKELKRRHVSLHIGKEFPKFLKSNFFDRFSEEVIKERKNCLVNLLNFIAKCPALFTTDIFVKFFQEGYNLSEYDKKKLEKDDISLDNEDEGNLDFNLALLKFQIMGQVLNSEGSQSSDDSESNMTISKKSKIKTNLDAYDKFKRNFNIGNETRFNDGNENNHSSFISKMNYKGMPDYWEEAVAHADEAHQQEILENYDVAFAMYKTAIVCLLSGVQGDSNVDHRMKVKELTSQYLLQAEWIYNNHLMFQPNPVTLKSTKVPWRSRSQLRRYKIVSILSNNLLVHDVTDDIFVIIKGVLKSSYSLDRSEICVLPKDVPYMVKLIALHETDTTVFLVLEHVRYGKLWYHLEHYFLPGYIVDNLDTEITCDSPQEKDSSDDADRNSLVSSGSSVNQSFSRLESSAYTDTMSCESLSSHDENYFDLIEDYARAKSQKLKEIQDFNERRTHVESLRPVKKTVSQVDLKSMDGSYEQHRSQSLTNLAHEDKSDTYDNDLPVYSQFTIEDGINSEYCFMSDDEENDDNKFSSSIDMDTQQLLKNAQKLIESINETLSKNENISDPIQSEETTRELVNDIVSNDGNDIGILNQMKNGTRAEVENVVFENTPEEVSTDVARADVTPMEEKSFNYSNFNTQMKELNLYSPISDSIPSITEEYSVTAILQKNGVTSELIKKWASQILIALHVLHQNGVICRDLNPNNILLSDNGSIKLTYFFRYPNVDPSLSNYAIERLYVAPEVNNVNSNITFASDWWSFGAVLYELVTSKSLYESHQGGITSHSVINIPEKVHAVTRSLLVELLRYDPNERLGSGISGADDIKSHPYFVGVNWEDV